jgi:integrase/recombinase XerD
MQKRITVTRGNVDGKACFLFDFPYDLHLISIFKSWNKARYHPQLKEWSAVDVPNLLREVFEIVNTQAYIDYRGLSRSFQASTTTKVQQKRKVELKTAYSDLHPETQKAIAEFKRKLQANRYSENTVITYHEGLSVFFRFIHPIAHADVNMKVVEKFNCDYILANDFSTSYQNQVINALKAFYRYNNLYLGDLELLERPRRAKRLPIILSVSEIQNLINSTNNIKHKSLLAITYGCALRMGDVLNLKLNDIDRHRGVIHIKKGKGNKDRLVPLPQNILPLLEKYYRKYYPKEFLFEGAKGGKYSSTSLSKLLKAAAFRAGIQKEITLHTLRHSCATHMLENGVNLRYIQEILGHNDPKTTQIYTHVTNDSLLRVESPLQKIQL